MKKSDNDDQSFFEYAKQKINEQFIAFLPSEAILQLPTFWVYGFGFFVEFGMLAMFTYFAYKTYVQGITQKYITLEIEGNCNSIERSISGEYIADTSGNWEGVGDFTYSLALYDLILADAKFTTEQYQDTMRIAYAGLEALGEVGKTQDLSLNIAIFVSWQLACSAALAGREGSFSQEAKDACVAFEESGQLFVFTSISDIVFDISNVAVTYSNVYGDCNSTTRASYNVGTATLATVASYQEFVSDPLCASIMDPATVGYDAAFDFQEFSQKLDSRTFGDAIGINMGFLELGGIEVVGNTNKYELQHNGVNYTAQFYIDPAYPGMEPLFCIGSDDETIDPTQGVRQLCFLQFGNVTGIPVFNHYGAAGAFSGSGIQSPQPCWCSEDAYGYTDYCDEMDLTVGMIFYQNETNPLTEVDQLRAAVEAIVQHATPTSTTYSAYANFSHDSYNATFASAASKDEAYVDPITKTSSWRESSYSFCNVADYGFCSMMVIHLFGDTIPDRATTNFMYQLKNGSCGDPFSIPKSSFQAMVDYPPTPIVENYYECTLSNVDAFNNAIGIASGNTSAYMPVIVLLLLPLIYVLLRIFNVPLPKEEYGEEEYKRVGQLVMKSLLRASDRKTRGMKKNGVIMQLAKELQRVDMYGSTDKQDSDDSDSEDDSSDGTAGTGWSGRSGGSKRKIESHAANIEEGTHRERGRSGRGLERLNSSRTHRKGSSNPLFVRAESVRDCANSTSPKPTRDANYYSRRASKTRRNSRKDNDFGTEFMNTHMVPTEEIVSNPMVNMSNTMAEEPHSENTTSLPVIAAPVPMSSSIRFGSAIDSDDEEQSNSGPESGPLSRNRVPSDQFVVNRNTTTGVELNNL